MDERLLNLAFVITTGSFTQNSIKYPPCSWKPVYLYNKFNPGLIFFNPPLFEILDVAEEERRTEALCLLNHQDYAHKLNDTRFIHHHHRDAIRVLIEQPKYTMVAVWQA